MNKLTVGKKIVFGFTALVLIAILIGVFAIVKMKSVSIGAISLNEAYVPEVAVSNEIERQTLSAMYADRGFGFTGDINYYNEAQKHLKEVMTFVDAATVLGNEQNLLAVKKSIPDIRRELEEYAGLADKTFRLVEELQEVRQQMEATSDDFVSSVAQIIKIQEAKLDDEIKEQAENNQTDIAQRILKIKWMNAIRDLGSSSRINNFKAQALRKPEYLQEALDSIAAMGPIFLDLQGIVRDREDIELLKTINEASEIYGNELREYSEIFNTITRLADERNEIAQKALIGIQSLAKEGIEATKNTAEKSAKQMTTSIRLMILGVLLAVVVGIILALLVAKSITKPLILAIDSLSSGAKETGSAAGEVSSASQTLAEGASEQAASLEETSSSMEEMASMVRRSAEVAADTSKEAIRAREATDDGVKQMGELRRSADVVSSSAKEMETAMHAIKESSDSISKIIKTIDEIAFQTNILALNAAVEAARAGEAGAGFSVVADEVRNLARRAADAARETASMIEDSMERSERGVKVNEVVGENLKAVMERAGDVEGGLNKIAESITSVSHAMEEIEASGREQQDGIDQINTAVSQVNDVTQGNAASAEEAASAAEEMNAQSVTLLEIVDTLTLMVMGHSSKGRHNQQSDSMDFGPRLTDHSHR